MHLTRQSEIAIGILVACARRPRSCVRTSVAAVEAGASKIHTSKVVHMLVHAGFISATRGRQGGLRLAFPAEAMPLAAVLRHTQPELLEGSRRSRNRRPALAHLDTIVDTARETLALLMDRFTIADLVEVPIQHRIPCVDCRLLKALPDALTSARVTPSQECGERHVPRCA